MITEGFQLTEIQPSSVALVTPMSSLVTERPLKVLSEGAVMAATAGNAVPAGVGIETAPALVSNLKLPML